MALPAAGIPHGLRHLSGRGWGLVAPLSIVVVAAAIAASSAGADVLAWNSLLLVPPGCAVALGWAAHGARPRLAPLAIPALALALAVPDEPLGRFARIALIAGSCVTVGRLLAGAAPLGLVKAGVVVMAGVDTITIFGHLLDTQNAQFVGAVPAAGLPRLQVAELGRASTDYGDFFVAGLVGAVLAVEGRPQLAAAVAMFGVSQAFDQLFLVVDSLPATVPPVLVMLALDVRAQRTRSHAPSREPVGRGDDRGAPQPRRPPPPSRRAAA